MAILYSKDTGGFYSRNIHGDNIPTEVVEITEAEHQALLEGQSRGKIISADSSGRPVLVDPPPPAPLTREQIEALRLLAYADPLTGSDRYFAEATRLQVMGADQAEIDAAKTAGTARYAEIQAEYPWPDDI